MRLLLTLCAITAAICWGQASPVVRHSSVQAGAGVYCRSTTGNDTYTCSFTPALTTYTRGGCLVLDADTANTGAATVNVNSVGAKSILNRSVGALATGDITANAPITVCYDGTQFIIQGDGVGNSVVAGDGVSVGLAGSTYTVSTDAAVVPRFFTVAGVPSGACTQGRDYTLNTSASTLYQCTATNTWALVGGVLAANGANCSAGQFPLGVDASGAAETCTALPTTIAGTANEVAASASTGAVTLSLPSGLNFGSKTVTMPKGTAVPGTCTIGDYFFDTDATAGQNVFGCTATNTWTVQGGGGSTLISRSATTADICSNGGATTSLYEFGANQLAVGDTVEVSVVGRVAGTVGTPLMRLSVEGVTVTPNIGFGGDPWSYGTARIRVASTTTADSLGMGQRANGSGPSFDSDVAFTVSTTSGTGFTIEAYNESCVGGGTMTYSYTIKQVRDAP